jgi:hypothetical protein
VLRALRMALRDVALRLLADRRFKQYVDPGGCQRNLKNM